jgi:hypothetical protein
VPIDTTTCPENARRPEKNITFMSSKEFVQSAIRELNFVQTFFYSMPWSFHFSCLLDPDSTVHVRGRECRLASFVAETACAPRGRVTTHKEPNELEHLLSLLFSISTSFWAFTRQCQTNKRTGCTLTHF